MASTDEKVAPLAFSIAEVVDLTGIARTTLYAAIRDGDLRARKYRRRTIILASDLDEFLAVLPDSNS